MAIRKAKTLSNGTSGDYWRILNIVIDRESLNATGRIALFKDAATSASGGKHLGLIKTFSFPLNMTEFLAAPNAVSYIYVKILDKANTMITKDLTGADIPPIPYDPDIADGESV